MRQFRLPVLVWLSLAVPVMTPPAPYAVTWRVAPDGSGDAATIQAAIDAASAGDSIMLEPGTYTWTSQGGDQVGLPGPSMITMRSGLTLISLHGPKETILDAEGNGRVIRCHSTSNVRIEGLTIQGGNAESAVLPGFYSLGVGGGILCKSGSMIVIANNIVRSNQSTYNGGAIALNQCSAEVTGNVISWNAGQFGLYISGGSADVSGNTLAANDGGGVGLYQCTGSISENLVSESTGGYDLWCAGASVSITCNDIWGSTSSACALGQGNIAVDPKICITSEEFHVQSVSPCLPENNACGTLMGARGIGCTASDLNEEQLSRNPIVKVFPNPFSRDGRIRYLLGSVAPRTHLAVYDLRGRLVKTLFQGDAPSRYGVATWDGTDEAGQPVAAGVYVARLETGSNVVTAKVVLVR